MNQEKIALMEETISREYANTAGISVWKTGRKAYERYWNGFSPDSAFHVFSVTKSIFSAVFGIAVGKGLVKGPEERVLDFFPDYVPKRGERTAPKVTIGNLLTMTAPFKYRSAPYTRYFSSPDWVKSALDLLGGKGEIGAFRYTPLIGPDILSGILTEAAGVSARAFAKEHLFSPLGIQVENDVTFETKEEQIAVMKDRHESGWVADPQGTNTVGWGLFLKLSDLAKLGRLYLNEGFWEGRPVVPATWIAESTKEHSRCLQWGNLAYGCYWWIPDQDSFAALGDGGNAIYVNRKKDLVVAIASLFKPTAKNPLQLIRGIVEPCFDDSPIHR